MVQVTFGAKTQDLEDGVSRAKSSIESLTTPTESAQRGFEGLNDAMKSLNDTSIKGSSALSGFTKMLGLGAVGGALAGLAVLLNKSGEEMTNLKRNSREAELSLRDFQELKFIANQGGVGDDKFVSSLQEASKKLNDLGHGTSDLSKFLDANNEKYELANGKLISTNDYLRMAARLIQNAATEGDKFKAAALLGFSREWVQILERGPAALQQGIDRARALGVALDDGAVNKAVEFEQKWKDSTQKWEVWMKAAIVGVTPFVDSFIELLGKGLAELRDVSVGTGKYLASGDWLTDKGRDVVKSIVNDLTAVSGAPSATLAERFRQFDQNSAALPDYWKTVRSELEAAATLMQSIGEGNFVSNKGSTKFVEKEDKDALRAAMEEMRGAIQLEEIGFASAKEHAESALKLYGTTEGQKTVFLLAELDKRTRMELELVAKQSEYETESLAAKQRVVNESLAIEARAAAARQKIIDQSAQAEAKAWEDMLKPVQGAFDSQLRGLLSGTITWAQATKNIMADLVLDLIKALETFVIKKAAVALASSLGDPSALIGNLRSIGGDLGQAYAGFAAFLAPIMGPAAPAAAAALTAEVGATAIGLSVAGRAEQGMYEIPAPGLWALHTGETVLPAPAATAFRQMAETGGMGGGGAVHFHVTAIDAAGVHAFFKQHAASLARTLQGHFHLNPSHV